MSVENEGAVEMERCEECDGEGEVKGECWQCEGMGTLVDMCEVCDGEGEIEVEKESN